MTGYNPYTPENKIYIVKNKDGKVERIIGSEQDRLAINSLAVVETKEEIKNSDIQYAIKKICETK
jgi:predicted metal-dependent TIM-barrel fold hydrolase